MKLIERDYLSKLINVMGTPDIKVITGVRRSGKSKLLEAFKKYIKKNISDSNIISINFNDLKFSNLKNYLELNDYIESKYNDKKKNFVCIDEIQLCDNFELTINSLHSSEKYDIYLTGSNAFLLSSDLATLFTGRVFEIKIYPFSFKEYLNYYGDEDIDRSFDDYIFNGGMSGAYIYNNQQDKYDYINEVYNALIARDIVDRYKIKNIDLLDNVNSYLMDNISNITTTRSIENVLNNNKTPLDHKTIGNYLQYLCNAFLYYKVKRYDIQGKQYLTRQDKYYLVDHGFKYAKLGMKNINYGRVYENIVAMELLRRGYEIYVGTLYNKEIDFVAMKQNEKIYIQVSDDISNEETLKREVDSLLKIRDAYPKKLIARTKHDTYTYEGVEIIDIAKWLAN